MRGWLCAPLGVALVAGVAGADGVDEERRLVAEGEALAHGGRYTEAIARFHAADAALPRAAHDCLIALARRHRQEWAQAELHVARCHERAAASADDPVPAWGEALRAEIAGELEKRNFARLTVEVTPEAARDHAEVQVSTLGDLERFAPRTVFVPVAVPVVVTVVAPGYQPARRSLTVEARPGRVERFDLLPGEAPDAPAPAEPPAPADSVVERRPAPVPAGAGARPWIALGTAGVGFAVGVTFHVLAADTRDQLARAATGADWDRHEADFDRQRAVAVIGYGVAAIAGGLGAYWLATAPRAGVRLEAAAIDGGAIVCVGWSR